MAVIESSVSPFHGYCTIGQPYGNVSSSYTCGFHTGVDFPASGVNNFDVYASGTGTITYLYKDSQGKSPSLGNQVQIKLDNSNIYLRYCHLEYESNHHLNLGDRVNTSTKIGVMGNTGNSTGRHLHLEASTSSNWQCQTFLNPRKYIRIWK